MCHTVFDTNCLFPSAVGVETRDCFYQRTIQSTHTPTRSCSKLFPFLRWHEKSPTFEQTLSPLLRATPHMVTFELSETKPHAPSPRHMAEDSE